MVRTTGGIRISAGKSSKKSGGGSGSTQSAPSTSSGKSSSRGSSRLPPIPYCEAPSWQKPITNFFNVDAGSSKNKEKIKEKVQEINAEELNMEKNCCIENKCDEEIEKDKTEIQEDKDDFNISGVEILENEVKE